MIARFLFALLFVCSIFSLEARSRSGSYTDPNLDELRLEIDDLKQTLHTTQIDLSLLEEKSKKQESSLLKQNKDSSTFSALSTQVTNLGKKISSLEQLLDKMSTDLRTLNTAFGQTANQIQHVETRLSSQDEKLGEVSKLKGTLTSIAKAVGERPSASIADSKNYRVKAGDSLEKIARQQHTTTDAIRKINNLSSDKIMIGQELRISHDPS